MLGAEILAQAASLLADLRAGGRTVATAESCTGGLVAAALTAVPGSSDAVLAGFVTYSNAAKARMLGVPDQVLERHGAVSAECATAMASGAVRESGADLAVSTTGIAGPGGGTAEKPVGLVFVGVASADGRASAVEFRFAGDRTAVRAATVAAALRLAGDRLREDRPEA